MEGHTMSEPEPAAEPEPEAEPAAEPAAAELEVEADVTAAAPTDESAPATPPSDSEVESAANRLLDAAREEKSQLERVRGQLKALQDETSGDTEKRDKAKITKGVLGVGRIKARHCFRQWLSYICECRRLGFNTLTGKRYAGISVQRLTTMVDEGQLDRALTRVRGGAAALADATDDEAVAAVGFTSGEITALRKLAGAVELTVDMLGEATEMVGGSKLEAGSWADRLKRSPVTADDAKDALVGMLTENPVACDDFYFETQSSTALRRWALAGGADEASLVDDAAAKAAILQEEEDRDAANEARAVKQGRNDGDNTKPFERGAAQAARRLAVLLKLEGSGLSRRQVRRMADRAGSVAYATWAVRHCLCLVFPLPSWLRTLPLPCVFHCLRGKTLPFLVVLRACWLRRSGGRRWRDTAFAFCVSTAARG